VQVVLKCGRQVGGTDWIFGRVCGAHSPVVWHLDSGLLGFEAVRILIGKKSAFNTARCCWQKKLRRQPLALHL
jgi:hypothetical protein